MINNYSNLKDVTLLITHYNRPHSLGRLLEAFRQLECHFGGIIVSDDASKFQNIQKVKELQTNYDFKIISSPQNKGLANNINKGQDAVTTPYTLYVQEDFVPTALFPKKLSESLEFMQERPALDMVRYYAYFRYPYLKPYAKGFSEMYFGHLQPGYKKFYFYSDHPHLRRSNFLEKFGRYKEGFSTERGEYWMMMSFLKRKGKALFYEDYQALFEQQNTNTEPSTVKRNFWRNSNNILVTGAREVYRYTRFNLDLLLAD